MIHRIILCLHEFSFTFYETMQGNDHYRRRKHSRYDLPNNSLCQSTHIPYRRNPRTNQHRSESAFFRNHLRRTEQKHKQWTESESHTVGSKQDEVKYRIYIKYSYNKRKH